MKAKALFKAEDSDDEHSNQRKAKKKKPKKLEEIEKLGEYAKSNDLSSFVNCMTDTLKHFEMMDPAIKKMIRDIFNEDPENNQHAQKDDSKKGNSLKNTTQTVSSKQQTSSQIGSKKDHKIEEKGLVSALKSKPKPFEDFKTKKTILPKNIKANLADENSEKYWTTASIKETQRSKSAEKLRAEYQLVIGYVSKFNQVKELNRIQNSSCYLIKADSLLSVYQKVTHLVIGDNHKGSLVLLYCLIAGIPVVGLPWVVQCTKDAKVVDPKPYEVSFDLNHKVFEKKNIAVYRDSNVVSRLSKIAEIETKLLLESIVKFGGTITEIANADVLVVLDVHIERLTAAKDKRDISLVQAVNKKWVVDCILENTFKNPINPIYELKL